MKKRIVKKKIGRIVGISHYGNITYGWTTNKQMGYKGSDMIEDEDMYSVEMDVYKKPKYGVIEPKERHWYLVDQLRKNIENGDNKKEKKFFKKLF